jgi:hypothetical protein
MFHFNEELKYPIVLGVDTPGGSANRRCELRSFSREDGVGNKSLLFVGGIVEGSTIDQSILRSNSMMSTSFAVSYLSYKP